MEYIYNKVIDIFNYLTGWVTATLNNILGNVTDIKSDTTTIKSKTDVATSSRATASEVDDILTASHGAGSWGGTSPIGTLHIERKAQTNILDWENITNYSGSGILRSISQLAGQNTGYLKLVIDENTIFEGIFTIVPQYEGTSSISINIKFNSSLLVQHKTLSGGTVQTIVCYST